MLGVSGLVGGIVRDVFQLVFQQISRVIQMNEIQNYPTCWRIHHEAMSVIMRIICASGYKEEEFLLPKLDKISLVNRPLNTTQI